MLSLDGFQADYVEKYDAKNLKKIASEGVRAMRMTPSNPTKTFPNHYTLVTGLYPDTHGLVHNSFYAPDLKTTYEIRDRKKVENGKFYGGEPIWATAHKAGLRTASYFWVGSEAKINGIRPDIWKKYNGRITFSQKIDSVISWLQKPLNQRPKLITLYHHEPDKSGHIFGPNSPQVAKTIHQMDSLVGVLHDKLMQLPIANKMNLIIMADHGMRELSDKRVIYLSKYLKEDWVNHLTGANPVYSIHVKNGMLDSVYLALKKEEHLHVYKNGRVPKKLRFGNNPRLGDIIVVAKKGWSVFPKPALGRRYGGTHGFLNTDEQMAAVFIGKGVGLKQGKTRKTIRNVDVYNLVAKLLGIQPANNDGKYRRVRRFVRK